MYRSSVRLQNILPGFWVAIKILLRQPTKQVKSSLQAFIIGVLITKKPTTMRVPLRPLLAIFIISWFSLVQVQAASDPTLQVKVKRSTGKIIIDVNMLAAVPPELAFEVMTDFNHMKSFLPNISSSKILKRDGNKLLVAQQGKASSGPVSFAFDTVREVTLTPDTEIHSKIISGTIKQGESSIRMNPEAHKTRIIIHSETNAPPIMPPILGVAFVESQTRKQYNLFREEMLRRQRAIDARPTPHPPAAVQSNTPANTPPTPSTGTPGAVPASTPHH